MAEITRLTNNEFTEIVSDSGFSRLLMSKDYYLTVILYLLKDIKGIYFKGGTALQKCFLNHSRLSEDVDYTLTRSLKEVRAEIESVLDSSKLFGKITQDKDVEGFVRLVVHYTGFDDENSFIFIDLNERGKLLTEPKKYSLKHFYPNIPQFEVPCLSRDEMFAEKMTAAISRNKPRDHFDLYMILKEGYEFDFDLVKKKCAQVKIEFDIERMFNRANKLHKKWDADMEALLSFEVKFVEVMQTLAKEFKLSDVKEKKRS